MLGKTVFIRIILRQWVLTKHELYMITFIIHITVYLIPYKEIEIILRAHFSLRYWLAGAN